MKIDSLIPNKFYYIKMDNLYEYYFKFCYSSKSHVYGENYFVEYDNKKFYYKEFDSNNFCNIDDIERSLCLYEIDSNLILEYLPDTNPDKIFYLRNKKIDYLLSITI